MAVVGAKAARHANKARANAKDNSPLDGAREDSSDDAADQNLWQKLDNNVTILNKLSNIIDSLSFGIDSHRSYIAFVKTVKGWSNHYRLVEKKYEELSQTLSTTELNYQESQKRENLQSERISSLQTEVEQKDAEIDFLRKKIRIIQEQLYSDASGSFDSEDDNNALKNGQQLYHTEKRDIPADSEFSDDLSSNRYENLKRRKTQRGSIEDDKVVIKPSNTQGNRMLPTNDVIITRKTSDLPNINNRNLLVSTPKLHDQSNNRFSEFGAEALNPENEGQVFAKESFNHMTNANHMISYLDENNEHSVTNNTLRPCTPKNYSNSVDIVRYFPMTHHFKTSTASLNSHCIACDKKIGFRKQLKQCICCNAICHPECFTSLPNPCFELTTGGQNSRSKTKLKIMLNFCPQHAPQVPGILVHLILEIEKRGLNYIGLYTINGSSKTVNTLMDKFFQSLVIPNFSIVSDIGVLTDCFKKFLISIDDSIIPVSLWTKFCRASIKNDSNELSKCVRQMKQPNRDTLALIMIHFQRVCANSKQNRATPKLLARSFADIIARYDDDSQDNAVHYFNKSENQITIIESLINLSSCIYIQILEYDTTKILKGLA
ncbi:MAG: Rac GTPase-activating protein 1 [Marteilia pararefringens]